MSAVSFSARMTVATSLGFMALGLRVNQPAKTCCSGIWRGEALVKALIVLTAGCLPLGLRLGELTDFWHCLPLHEYYGKIPLKVVGGGLKQKCVSS